MMQVRQQHHSVFAAVVSRYLTITGLPDYWTDLGGRVYQHLWLPSDNKVMMPYLCIVTADDAPTFERDDGHGPLLATLTLSLFGFVAESHITDVNGTQQDRIYKLQDDLLKCHLQDETYGGVVAYSTPIGRTRVAGVQEMFAEIQMGLQLAFYLDAAQLGP